MHSPLVDNAMQENMKTKEKTNHSETDFGFSTINEEDKVKQVREVFDKVAPKYDLMNDLLSFGTHRWWKRCCIETAALQPGMKILDLASGTGDLAIAMAKVVGAGNVISSDINHEMLMVGKQRLQEHNVPCPVVEADAESLPFADNSFDLVTVSFGLRNMTHKDNALKEMLRVLKPGGRVLVLEFSKCQPWLSIFYDFYSFKVMPWLGAKIAGDADSYRYLAESIQMHPSQPVLAEMMRKEGFVDVLWQNLTFGICALHQGKKPLPTD